MHSVTLQLSDSAYHLVNQIAQTTGQSIETVLQKTLLHTLPPLDDLSTEEAVELAHLSLLDDAALWREADRLMDEASQAELEAIQDRQREGESLPDDNRRLEQLLDQYGQLMVRKAHAWLLLARRGYRVPPQDV